MGLLLRIAFWFSLVLLALPLGGSGEGDAPSVGPIQALMAARDAVGDLSGICERKPDVCETGKSAMHTVGVRAKEAVRIAYQVLDQNRGEPDAETVTGGIPEIIDAAEKSAAPEPLPAN